MFPREALALHSPNIIPRLKEQYNTITVDVAKYRLGKVKFEQMLPAAVFLFCSMWPRGFAVFQGSLLYICSDGFTGNP